MKKRRRKKQKKNGQSASFILSSIKNLFLKMFTLSKICWLLTVRVFKPFVFLYILSLFYFFIVNMKPALFAEESLNHLQLFVLLDFVVIIVTNTIRKVMYEI